MTREQFDEFVGDLIHKHRGIEPAMEFVNNKIQQMADGFSYLNGQSFDDPNESLGFWTDVWDELNFRIDLN